MNDMGTRVASVATFIFLEMLPVSESQAGRSPARRVRSNTTINEEKRGLRDMKFNSG
jgi:hypothetical protein